MFTSAYTQNSVKWNKPETETNMFNVQRNVGLNNNMKKGVIMKVSMDYFFLKEMLHWQHNRNGLYSLSTKRACEYNLR